MDDLAISIKSVGKVYRKGERVFQRGSFKEAIVRGITRLTSVTPKRSQSGEDLSFWALRDVNLEIKKGNIVGLIGANGSGKSTLLKILARVTRPTTGIVKIFGAIGSLLEVGTGFHPELTGRENVYLNGAILGMRRKEIEAKFDAIVDFSGVEEFLDTPVKRYSSGMQIRLAFSVAAFLDPEILLLDEVLAVGDAAFQKKSLERMQSVVKDGRTVVLVSHNMDSVRSLCNSSVMLNRGEILYTGATEGAIESYLSLQQGEQREKSD